MLIEQLQIPLPVLTALGREDFFVSESNALAVALVESWENWAGHKMVLNGKAGSGKTHLAHVWAKMSGARIVAAQGLEYADIPSLADQNICVENVDQIAGNLRAEEAMFHLHNLVLAQGHFLMLTGCAAPKLWPLQLPDLHSRIQGAQSATLSGPDDMLLSALLVKLFSDRQIVPASDVIPYLLRQMPRSYEAARTLVDRLDRASLTRPSGVNRPLAIQILSEMTGADETPEDTVENATDGQD
ncbi:chromosomal replication initiator DnaA [Tropicibacter sp. R15_0]|uniref:chromosomal replication initiator DnaA n=1 Tax=Tropicibacter sp. R15_0 TaxID=2821101 RepID=UPI002570E3D6|nr:chromosomal replication initiator DnaA [Tropicibacter sp. R15_0]